MSDTRRIVNLMRRRKNMIDIDFEFHPVGQGLFYSGIFNHRRGEQFSMVYDCGTDSSRQYINDEIDSFVSELDLNKDTNDKLDVLFISHFHADHTNKIADLLNKTNGAKYAILPYLNPDELFLAFTDYVNSDYYLDDDGNPDQNLLLLFSNPKSFFKEFRVDNIIFIHPDDEFENGNEEENPEKDDDPSFDNFQFRLINNLKKNTEQKESDSNVEHCFDSGSLRLNAFWEFKLFNKPRITIAIDSFKKDIKAFIKGEPTQSNLSNYIELNKKTFQKSFQTIYEKHFGKKQLINQTSLIVYHGALDQEQFEWYLFNFHKRTGTLLTADICFDDIILSEIKKKWIKDKYFDNLVLFQVPHHGSENDMTAQVFKDYNNVYLWLINFGLGNRHKLPHQKIIDKLVDNGKIGNIFSNTQIQGFRYYFYLL